MANKVRSSALTQFLSLLLTAGLLGLAVEGQRQPPPECFLPQDTGPCRAFFPSYSYDPVANVCDCFIYGGCLGNANRFDTVTECMAFCQVPSESQFETDACRSISNPLQTPPPPPPPTSTPLPPPPSTPLPPSRPALPTLPPRVVTQAPPPAVETDDDPRIEDQPGAGFDSKLSVTIDGPYGPKTIVIGEPIVIKRS